MKYYTYNEEGRYNGSSGTQPTHSNWTLTPYQGGLVKEFWNGNEWIENATPEEIAEANKQTVPNEVTRLQFLMALNLIGVKEQNIYDFVEMIEDEDTKYLAKLQLKNCLTFNRNNEMLNNMAPAFGLSQEQLDELFINANNIIL